MLISWNESAKIGNAHERRAELLDGFASDGEITLDIAELADADLTFLQLVEAARTYADRTGKAFRLTAPANAAVSALLRRAGFLTEPSSADLAFWFHGECPQ